jgi:hypothetical protein
MRAFERSVVITFVLVMHRAVEFGSKMVAEATRLTAGFCARLRAHVNIVTSGNTYKKF